MDRYSVVAADADHVAARDPAQAIIAGRRPHLALADDEEMGRIAGRDEAVRIEHQPFVGAGLRRLDAGRDAVELGMRIELRVLHRGIAAADMDGKERQPLFNRRGQRILMFGNDDDRRGRDDHARILIGGRADTARHHQADMARVHPVGIDRVIEPPFESFARNPDVHRDRLCALPQPIEMLVEKRHAAAVDADTLPHPVTEHEAAVKDRHAGFGARNERAVDVD